MKETSIGISRKKNSCEVYSSQNLTKIAKINCKFSSPESKPAEKAIKKVDDVKSLKKSPTLVF